MIQDLNNVNSNFKNTITSSIYCNAETQHTNQTSSNNLQDKTHEILERSFGEMHVKTSTSTDIPEIKKAQKLGEGLQSTPEKSYACTSSYLDREKLGSLNPSNKTALRDFFNPIPESLLKSIFSLLNMNERAIFGRVNKVSNHIMFKKLQEPSLIGTPIPLVASLRIQEILNDPIDLYKYLELLSIKQLFHGTTLTALSSARHLNLSLTTEDVKWITNDTFSIRHIDKIIWWPNSSMTKEYIIKKLQRPKRFTCLSEEMAKQMPNLQILDLYINEITGKKLNKFKNLNSLHSIELDSSSNAALGELTPARFPLLEKLVLDCGSTTTNKGMRHLANLTTLQDVSIYGYPITLYPEKKFTYLSLKYFRTLPSLTMLTLNGCYITDSGLAQLGELKTLKKLVLHEIHAITDDAFLKLENLQLEFLSLMGTPRVTGSLFRHLNPLRLKTLEFMEQDDISADFVSIVALTALEHLDLSECYGLRDHHLQPLADMTSLQSLGLSKCHHITPACVNDLRRSLPFADIQGVRDYAEDDSSDHEHAEMILQATTWKTIAQKYGMRMSEVRELFPHEPLKNVQH